MTYKYGYEYTFFKRNESPEQRCQTTFWNLIQALDTFDRNVDSTMYIRELLFQTQKCDYLIDLSLNRFLYIDFMGPKTINRIKNYSTTSLDKQIATRAMNYFGNVDYCDIVSGFDLSNWIYYKMIYQPERILKSTVFFW
jgi:hypothetical protein